MILDGVEDQNSPVCGLAANPPFLEKIDCVSFNVGAIEGIDSDQGDLRMGLFVDLLKQVSLICAVVVGSRTCAKSLT